MGVELALEHRPRQGQVARMERLWERLTMAGLGVAAGAAAWLLSCPRWSGHISAVVSNICISSFGGLAQQIQSA